MIPSSLRSAPTGAAAGERPKRPLTAYNLFFKHQRDLILRSTPSEFDHSHDELHSTLSIPSRERRDKSKAVRPPPHRKIGFADLARQIGRSWKELDRRGRAPFVELARQDKTRYLSEVRVWKSRKEAEERDTVAELMELAEEWNGDAPPAEGRHATELAPPLLEFGETIPHPSSPLPHPAVTSSAADLFTPKFLRDVSTPRIPILHISRGGSIVNRNDAQDLLDCINAILD
jgi:hypothetical protein